VPAHHPVQCREFIASAGAEMRKYLSRSVGTVGGDVADFACTFAVKPVVVESVRFDGTPEVDPDLSGACGFPVTVSTKDIFASLNSATRMTTLGS
jgi:hypothetical protein